MIRKKINLLWLLLIYILFFVSSLSFALMEGLSTDRLTKESEMIITGEVEDVQSQWSNDGKTIFTSATIVIQALVKGQILDERIIVEYKGGEIGNVGMKVSDEVAMEKGEKVLLFIKPGIGHKNGEVFNIVGKAQGKYTIDDDGIANKRGFSIIGDSTIIDNNIPIYELINKIRGVK